MDEGLRVRPNSEAPRPLQALLTLLPVPARLLSMGQGRFMVRVIVPVPYLGVQITRGLRVAIRIATDGGYEIGPFVDNNRANFADSEPS